MITVIGMIMLMAFGVFLCVVAGAAFIESDSVLGFIAFLAGLSALTVGTLMAVSL